MAWVKLDDQFFFKPRARDAGLEGRAMFFAGLCYCACNRTDGRIKTSALPLVAGMAEVGQDIARLLVDIGLWVEMDDGYEVVDYLRFNPSRAQLEADAAAAAERQARSRSKSQRESRRDTESGGGVSSTAPSPLPSPIETSSSSSSVTQEGPPAEVWNLLAQKKLKQAKGVNNPTRWLSKVADNDREEMGPRAQELWDRYEISTSQLVDVLAAGGTSGLLNSLTKKNAG